MQYEDMYLGLIYRCVCCSHQLLQGVVLGVGQIFACGTLGPSLLILGAVFLFSPILAVYALLGSGISTMAGESGIKSKYQQNSVLQK